MTLLKEAKRTNELLEAILAKVSAVIAVRVIQPNRDPIFNPPASLDILMGTNSGTSISEFATDPDGDPLVFTIEPNDLLEITPEGFLRPKAVGEGNVTIWVDDGRE